MPIRSLVLILLTMVALMLQACGGTYVASEYPLEEEQIPAMEVRGDVTVDGAYEEATPITIGGRIDSDLKQISDQFARQLEQEIDKLDGSGSAEKTITVRVTNMGMANRFAYMEGRIDVELALGNGETVSFDKRNGSPGVIDRVLNGTIARAVLEALENEKVQAYLAE